MDQSFNERLELFSIAYICCVFSGVWIGLNDIEEEDTFRWTSNNQHLGSWSDWRPGMPRGSRSPLSDCIILTPTVLGRSWGDHRCDGRFGRKYRSLCEQWYPVITLSYNNIHTKHTNTQAHQNSSNMNTVTTKHQWSVLFLNGGSYGICSCIPDPRSGMLSSVREWGEWSLVLLMNLMLQS